MGMNRVMVPVMQTQFGADYSAPPEEIGNCQQAAFASVLALPLNEVPHFSGLYSDDGERYDKMIEWLGGHGLALLTWDWSNIAPFIPHYWRALGDACFVMGGKSPRGEHQHAVVGRLTANGWELVHDPHPDGTGIIGEPMQVDFLIAKVRAP